MTSCDTNVLFAACDADNPCHQQARDFLEAHRGNQNFVLAEQVLMELYILLRNPAVSRPPLTPGEAVATLGALRSNPSWRIVDVVGDADSMHDLWRLAAQPNFAYRRLFDVRLALTLRHHGVTEFATSNTRDFTDLKFARVWDPLRGNA